MARRKTWLTSKNRKRHQREMNKIMRELNKNIEKDNLWKGRFYVRQITSQWREYEDKSGAELYVVLQFYDKETGISKKVAGAVNAWRFFDGISLWWEMNDFIVKDVKA